MRTIKFRGKRIDSNEWVYGYLSFIYVNGKNSEGFKHTEKARIYSPDDCQSYDVWTETIGQYIGFNDINGKEIYEGDIADLDGFSPSRYIVDFNRGGFCLYMSKDDDYYIDCKYLERSKVIGNIH